MVGAMTKEEMDQLLGAFPGLWRDCDGPWCGSGWFDLLMAASWAIDTVDPSVTLVQVKEKFGGLRIYASSNGDSSKPIAYAERLSWIICE